MYARFDNLACAYHSSVLETLFSATVDSVFISLVQVCPETVQVMKLLSQVWIKCFLKGLRLAQVKIYISTSPSKKLNAINLGVI